jgi:hypothetical protein
MSTESPIRVLLGPQRPTRNVGEAVARAGLPEGPLAVISAGWQEAEGYIEDVKEIVDRPLEDLRLYGHAEDARKRDPGLAAAMRERQERLIEQQHIYRLRLKQLSIAARHMLRAEGDAAMIAAEQRHAIAQLRALDRHHLQRTEKAWSRFTPTYHPDRHSLLAEYAARIEAQIERSAGVLITGGNVAILINRLRMFGLERVLARTPIIAWSGGAMALADRIVLFHERSPEGPRDAEIFGAGLGIVPGYVILPDTKHRLRKRQTTRMELMSRRFSPDLCVSLNSGAEMHIDTAEIRFASDVQRLGRDGRLRTVRAA